MSKNNNNFNKGNFRKDTRKNIFALLIIGLVVFGCICSMFLAVWVVSRDIRKGYADTVVTSTYSLNSIYLPFSEVNTSSFSGDDILEYSWFKTPQSSGLTMDYHLIRTQLTLSITGDSLDNITCKLGAYNDDDLWFTNTSLLYGNTNSLNFITSVSGNTLTHSDEIDLLSSTQFNFGLYSRGSNSSSYIYGVITRRCNFLSDKTPLLWFLSNRNSFDYLRIYSDIQTTSLFHIVRTYVEYHFIYNNNDYYIGYVAYSGAFGLSNRFPYQITSDRIYYYNTDYDSAYFAGKSQGYNEGLKDNQQDIFNKGFDAGKIVGKQEGIEQSNDYSFLGLMSSVVDVPIRTLGGLMNFDLLGVNLLGFFYALLTVGLIIFIVRLVIGGK